MESTPGLGPIRWQDYPHEHMWQMLVQANPETMFTEAEDLRKLAEELGQVTTDAHAIAQDVFGAWNGQAAEDAANRIGEFLKWADQTANTANSIAGLLSEYAHVVNRARLTIPYPVSSGGMTPQGKVASPAESHARKTEAAQVMEHYASQSRDIYARLHTHQFTAPPTGTGLPLPAPAPEPAPPVHQPPTTHQPTTPSPDLAATTPSSVGATAPSGFVDGTGYGAGGLASGVVNGLPGGAAAPIGPGGMSAVAAMDAEAAMARMAATAEGQAGWNGFAPMSPGRGTGAEDDKHRDRFARQTDLVGELPPAFPPVLGL
jgi:hypothetical protein